MKYIIILYRLNNASLSGNTLHEKKSKQERKKK